MYWVVEFADGILPRETSLRLASNDVKARLHRLILCAGDALGALGGVKEHTVTVDRISDPVSGWF